MNENEKSARETIETWLKENDVEEFMREKAPKENVLSEAHRIIYGDREKTYGSPSKNLRVIAEMWNAYLGNEICLTAQDVCVMMILLKAARLKNTPGHRDSTVDICGYAALIERCDE
jgi:translation initiation factor 2 alpha subunit (eIF-2alpha)